MSSASLVTAVTTLGIRWDTSMYKLIAGLVLLAYATYLILRSTGVVGGDPAEYFLLPGGIAAVLAVVLLAIYVRERRQSP